MVLSKEHIRRAEMVGGFDRLDVIASFEGAKYRGDQDAIKKIFEVYNGVISPDRKESAKCGVCVGKVLVIMERIIEEVWM